jgi:hypothetical protein
MTASERRSKITITVTLGLAVRLGIMSGMVLGSSGEELNAETSTGRAGHMPEVGSRTQPSAALGEHIPGARIALFAVDYLALHAAWTRQDP